jgi:hypothetical protein
LKTSVAFGIALRKESENGLTWVTFVDIIEVTNGGIKQ